MHGLDVRRYHRVDVGLSKREKQRIGEMLRKGRQSARVLRRALVLQQLDMGQTAAQVGLNLALSSKAVRAIALRFEQEGLEAALVEKPRPGKRRLLDEAQSQQIVAMVCGPAPAGQARWSVRLIATEAVRRKLVPRVGRETIRMLLESHDLKPWREKNVVRGGAGPRVHRTHGRRVEGV